MRKKYKEFQLIDEEGNLIKIYRPMLRVVFCRGNELSKASEVLLDSGADLIVLPISIARYFEVPLKKEKILPVLLADGKVGEIYKLSFETHKISIFCNGLEIKESIAFSEGQETPLLGQDFFKHFKVNFDRKNRIFELFENR
jgi:predicted aspartyl protease